MKKEMIERLRTAGEYQKKAVRALFPERMNGHLDVIEREMKAMFFEMIADFMREEKNSGKPEHASPKEKDGKARKIDIL